MRKFITDDGIRGPNRGKAFSKGFTLVELLVVIGVMAALAAMLLPAIYRVRRQGVLTRSRQDLHSIAIALEAFKQDFGDYPRPSNVNTNGAGPSGSAMLGLTLIGSATADTSGMTCLTPGYQPGGPNSRVYGPYIQATGISTSYGSSGSLSVDGYGQLYNRRGQPILYFPAHSPVVDPTQLTSSGTGGLIGDSNSYYDPGCGVWYNPGLPVGSQQDYPLDTNSMSAILGDIHVIAGTYPAYFDTNGTIEPALGEVPVYLGPYLLWDAGVNPYFGLVDDNGNAMPVNPASVNLCDDVTNFR